MKNILDFESFNVLGEMKFTREGIAEFFESFYELIGSTENEKLIERVENTSEMRLSPDVKELAIKARNRKALKKASLSAVKALRHRVGEGIEFNGKKIASSDGNINFSIHDKMFILECIFCDRETGLSEDDKKIISERVEALVK